MRRATRVAYSQWTPPIYFYPRSPCGERQNRPRPSAGIDDFYPRSPCGERPIAGRITSKGTKFLSTLSLRRATARRESRQQPAGISIHALLAESDGRTESIAAKVSDFYPRSPCGERPGKVKVVEPGFVFLSTLSLRRATENTLSKVINRGISIHALLAESDRNGFAMRWNT